MMSDQSDIIYRSLSSFGLSSEESKIYLYLLQKSSQSALTISRDLHMARTRVYRLLDKLSAKGLVTEQLDHLGLKFQATAYTQLELLLAEKEQHVQTLRASLPSLFAQFAQLSGADTEKSKVYYHHGIDGLKHVTWNSLNAKGTLRIYEKYDSMSVFLPQDFSEIIREELVKRNITTHQLTGVKHIKPYTDVCALMNYWQVRYVDPTLLTMKFEVLIYNDVYCMYQYGTGEEFCVEIHNKELAGMQTQLFDYVWQTATPMKIIGQHGEAKVPVK